jgi:DNA-binding XRE family transcriptional regulator
MKKKTIKIGEFVFRPFEDILKEYSKSKVFRVAYKEESARLKMIKQVRDTRLAKKMTQKKLAAKTGMPQSAIARIESGRKGLSLATLSRVAAALGKEVSLV